jgi:hypothetical protein
LGPGNGDRRRAVRPSGLACILFLMAMPAFAQSEWRPTRAQIAAAESRIVMPQGAAGPLVSYARYYSGERRNGRRLIVGELVRLTRDPVSPPVLKVVPTAGLPALADFGCGVIRFTYDVAGKTLSPLECGGETPLPPPRN